MGRALILSNGILSLNLNQNAEVADIFYPYIGQESHVSPGALSHKIGLFVDDQISWTSDDGWTVTTDYHDGTMVGDTVAINQKLELRLELTDVVDPKSPIFARSIHVVNLSTRSRTAKLFIHQAFCPADSNASSTAQYRPDLPAMMHYRGDRVFMITLTSGKDSFDDYSVGQFSADGSQSTYHDAANGQLSKNQVDNGQVDSVMGLTLELEAHGSGRAEQIMAVSVSPDRAETLFQQALKTGADEIIHKTSEYWRRWLEPAVAAASSLPDNYKKMLIKSLLITKAHVGRNGAVIASLDNSLRQHPQNDNYMFCWGRDAAYILWPLVRLGYTEEALSYFDFVENHLRPGGYLSHKYRPDGSIGTTWLPYQHADGTVGEPVQADETASTLFLFGQYYRLTGDKQTIISYYNSTITPMADFLTNFTDDSGLPRPSYHLWEHEYFTNTYTVGITYAALLEASGLAEATGHTSQSERYRLAAEAMKSQVDKLYNEGEQYFYRGIRLIDSPIYDATIDIASLYGVFMYGLIDLDSEMFQNALESAKSRLKAENGLFIRFEGDDYAGEAAAPNTWPLTSLWMAEIAAQRDEYDEAERIIDKIIAASPDGLIPEQLTPDTSAPASVQPLAWSHAELVSTLLDLLPHYTKKAHKNAQNQ